MVEKKALDSNGEVTRERKGLPRTNLPVVLPTNPTFLKQSNLITLMTGDFKTVQLRVIISVIEKLQVAIEQSISFFNNTGTIPFEQLSLFQEYNDRITIKLAYKDIGVDPDQYREVKKAVKSLITLPVEFDVTDPETGEPCWLVTGLFLRAHGQNNKYARSFTLEMDREVAKMFVRVDKGFTRYIKEIAYKSQSRYTVRMYMLISSWKEKGGFSIYVDKFRKFLKLEEKYPNYKDLYKRIIRPVYEDLFENADCWFEVAEVYRDINDTQPYKLNFKIVRSAPSKKEEETLSLQKRNIGELLRRHARMREPQVLDILNKITLENYQRVLNKTVYLCEYISNNWQSISSIPDYFHAVLTKELQPECGLIGEPTE